MSPRIALIADDLTGALDTSAGFALHGMRVAVAVEPGGIAEALAGGAEVVAVNTASRDLAPAAAASRVVEAAEALLAAGRPRIVFKKIDSRLKGNVSAETTAVARALRFGRALVAPAVPDQARFTIGGAVTGRGVDAPLPVRLVFGDVPLALDIRDARCEGDLDEAAADYAGRWGEVLAIGARGLGNALARAMSGGAAIRPAVALEAEAVLFAFGSTDPITLAQIDALRSSMPIVEAPGGGLPAMPPAARLPLLLHVTGEREASTVAVAERFAEGVAGCIAARHPAAIVMGGGDTTLAILRRLGARVIHPVGEAAAGLPVFDIPRGGGAPLRCVAKSGGFGPPDVLARLVGRAALSGVEASG